jgi:translation initiation factor IF-1
MSDDKIELRGVVISSCRGLFTVDCKLGAFRRTVLARCSGRLLVHRIRVLPGDEVTVAVSPYDPGRGVITFRGVRAA